MPLFLPLTILSSAAAAHIRQNIWGQTNRLEKWFVKICWDSCWILRACLYQAKKVQQRTIWFQKRRDPCSACMVHAQASKLFAEISCTKMLWGYSCCCYSLPCPCPCLVALAELGQQPKLSRPLSYILLYPWPYPTVFHRHLISLPPQCQVPFCLLMCSGFM